MYKKNEKLWQAPKFWTPLNSAPVSDVLNFRKKLVHFAIPHIDGHIISSPDVIIVALSLK